MNTVNSQYTRDSMGTNTIRPIVQGIEQLQKLRIATGNRIAAISRNLTGKPTNILQRPHMLIRQQFRQLPALLDF